MTDTSRSPKPAIKPKRRSAAARARARVDRMRDQATSAVEASAEAIDSAPLSALAGAIALGAVAAALIPNSRRELQMAGPVGDRVRDALEEAFAAAKSAGADQLTAKGLTSTALSKGLGQLVGNILTAVMAASTAASDSVRQAQATTRKAPPRKRA